MSETGHLTPEDMVALGEPFSQFDDLPGLPPDELNRIMMLCKDEPDEESVDFCVPCRAFKILADGADEPMDNPAPGHLEQAENALDAESFEETPVTRTPRELPVVDRFREAVHGLDDLVREMLEGPPIPPPNVSQEELALLVVAAQRWIAMTEAQGVELGGTQKAVFDATKSLVARLHRG